MSRSPILAVALVSISLAARTAAGQFGQSTGPDCGSSGPFVTNARNRAVVILAKVVAPPDWEAPRWKGPARLEVLEIMKGQVASPLMEVLADRDSGVRLGVGEQWLIALQDSGIPFIQGCGVFAVKVEGGHAIGHVESNKGSWQSVPLERIRSLVRDSAQTER